MTAYISYICGYFSHVILGPESVALYESRGLEDPVHKAFMRATVIALDMMIYFPVIWLISRRCYHDHLILFVFNVIFAMIQVKNFFYIILFNPFSSNLNSLFIKLHSSASTAFN